MYTQGRVVDQCLSIAKWSQIYSRPNYPAYSINDVCPNNLSKTCQNKGLWSASHLTWSMLAKLSTLPLLKYPLMVLGASKLKFYNLTDTRLFVLTVNCYSDVQKMHSKALTLTGFPAIFAALYINTWPNSRLNLI